MTIIINPCGGFGNVLAFYTWAFILAKKFNTKIKINWHSDENESDLRKKDTRLCLKNIMNMNYITNEIENKTMIVMQYKEHLNNILKLDNINCNITIDKLIWNIPMIYQNINIIKESILINNINNPIILNEDDIVFSFRIGMGESEISPEAYEIHHKLPFYYYENAIKNLNLEKSRFIICSDNFSNKFEEQIIAKLNKYENQKIYCNFDTLTQFKILCDAPYLISSNSTFSIWATLFTQAKKIIYPKYKSSGDIYFNSIDDIKYYPNRENSLYIEI